MRQSLSSSHPIHRLLSLLLSGAFVASLTVGCNLLGLGGEPTRPLDMKKVIPKNWTPIQELLPVNLDGDADTEWLLFYRYDVVDVGGRAVGPIGGVIFDIQTDSTTGTSMLVPYKLLPDFKPGKGQGYLGEQNCTAQAYDSDGDGNPDELAVFGYGYGPHSLNYLTIFRWQGSTPGRGYRIVKHFYGDGGLNVTRANPRDKMSPITRVEQKTRLNDRSLLSKKSVYDREGDGYVLTQLSLDFTYDIPSNPYYPEAAVLAYYLFMLEGKIDRAENYLLPEIDRPQVVAAVVTAGEALPSDEFSPPVGEVRAIPLALSYSGDAKVQEQSRAGSTVPSGYGPISYADVTVDVIEGELRTNRTWRVVNLPAASCDGEVCWRLLGQR